MISAARHQTCSRFNNGGCDNDNTSVHGFNYCKGFWCFLGGGTRRSTLVHQLRDGHTRILNLSNPNVQVGIYMYRLTTGDKTITKKIIISH